MLSRRIEPALRMLRAEDAELANIRHQLGVSSANQYDETFCRVGVPAIRLPSASLGPLTKSWIAADLAGQ